MRETKLLCSGLLVVAMAIKLSQPVQAFEGPTKTRTLPAATKQKVDFVRDIQPLFRKNCYSCHAVEIQEAGLRLDRKKLAQLGRLHGPMGTNILAQTAIWIWHPRH